MGSHIRRDSRDRTGDRCSNAHPGEKTPVAIAPSACSWDDHRFFDLAVPRIALARWHRRRLGGFVRDPYSFWSSGRLEYGPVAAAFSFAAKSWLAVPQCTYGPRDRERRARGGGAGVNAAVYS